MLRASRLSAILLLFLLPTSVWSGADLIHYAFVQDDGTLKVRGRTVHLYGIYIPATDRNCRTFQRPIQCAPRAALALDFKIDGFVHCDIKTRNSDKSLTALCRVNGEDLSAYMLTQGWALALPDAPFEYAALEKIARHKGLGVWGFPVDRIHRRHHSRKR